MTKGPQSNRTTVQDGRPATNVRRSHSKDHRTGHINSPSRHGLPKPDHHPNALHRILLPQTDTSYSSPTLTSPAPDSDDTPTTDTTEHSQPPQPRPTAPPTTSGHHSPDHTATTRASDKAHHGENRDARSRKNKAEENETTTTSNNINNRQAKADFHMWTLNMRKKSHRDAEYIAKALGESCRWGAVALHEMVTQETKARTVTTRAGHRIYRSPSTTGALDGGDDPQQLDDTHRRSATWTQMDVRDVTSTKRSTTSLG